MVQCGLMCKVAAAVVFFVTLSLVLSLRTTSLVLDKPNLRTALNEQDLQWSKRFAAFEKRLTEMFVNFTVNVDSMRTVLDMRLQSFEKARSEQDLGWSKHFAALEKRVAEITVNPTVNVDSMRTGLDMRLQSFEKEIVGIVGAINKERPAAFEKRVAGISASSNLDLTALVDRSGLPRVFNISQCPGQERVTLLDLYPVFAGHRVEWTKMGKEAPWWSVLSIPEFTKVTDSMKDRFYADGEAHINLLLQAMRAETVKDEWAVYATYERKHEDFPIDVVSSNVKSPFKLKPHSSGSPFGKVLDFGCGLGRLAFNFAKSGSECTCVDQSIEHLRQAETEWKERKRNLQQDVHFVASTPDLLSIVRGERFDFVHSVLVLQHMVPQLQAVYLEQFCDILRVGGQGWVQIPLAVAWTYAGGAIVAQPCNMSQAIAVGGMQMHSTPAVNIRDHFAARGCEIQVLGLSRRYMGMGKSGLVLFRKMK